MRRVRLLPVIALCCAVWWACTEGGDPTAAGRSVPVAIAPRFQIDPALFATSPVDRILLQARDAATRIAVGTVDRTVNPAATQWSFSLGIDLGGQATRLVIVEAELYSGSAVVWSGRLGPFTVPSAAPAMALDIYPGPLDNLDVLSLNVLGAPSQLVAGGSVTLTAELTLVAGSDATPIVQWASTNSTVATVTATGSTVTLTALTAGTADIVASVGTQDYQFTLEVLPPGTATKTWVGGATAGATSWAVADNWSPTGVPSSTDDVLIPATANDPVLSTAALVNDLTIQSGATLDLGDFAVNVFGELRVDGSVVNGQVGVGGTGTLLQGNFADLLVVADRAASGPITVSGNLSTAAYLTVGANLIDVGGDFATLAGGRLVMTTAGGVLDVGGSAVFGGVTEAGFLTAGQLHVDGDFVVVGPDPQAFVASGAHSVSLNGASLQTIDMANPGPTTHRFANLNIDNSGGVDLAGDAYAAGNVFVSSALTVAGGQDFDIGGVLTLEAGSTLNVDGAVTAASCVNLGATITGSGTHPCGAPAGGATKIWIGGATPDPSDWNDANNWSPVGVPGANDTVSVGSSAYNPTLHGNASVASLTVDGSNTLYLGDFTLGVSGNLNAVNGIYGGLVQVTGAGSVLQGYFDALTVSADRMLTGQLYTSGPLEIQGALDTNGQSATIVGTLTVSGSGTLVMTDPSTYVYVYGDATFNGGDHTSALTAGELAVAGDLHATDASPTSFVSSGTHRVSLIGGVDQTLTFEIPGPTSQRLNDLDVSYLTRATFSTGATASGDVAVSGHVVVPQSSSVTVNGAMSLDSYSVLQVDGTLVVSSGCTAEPGTIIIGGGTQPCGTPTLVDRIWLGGALGAEPEWYEPTNWSPVGVPDYNESVFIPYADWEPTLTDNAGVGALIVQYNASLDLGGYPLEVQGDLRAQGAVYNGLIQLTGSGSVLEGYVPDLEIGVNAPRALSGWLYVDGNADIQAKLTVTDYLYVTGDLVTSIDGELAMDNSDGLLAVDGNIDFGGLRTDLTQGALYAYGDLTIGTPWTPGAVVYLVGTGDQLVTLTSAGIGTDEQYFTDLYIGNSSGTVTFAGDVFVTGEFNSFGSTIARSGGGLLEVQGTFYAAATTFDGLPVRIDTNVTPGFHALASLTFTGFAATDTQLFIRMPGSVTPLTLASPVFGTAPTPFSGYYIDAGNNAAGTLTIAVTSATPASAAAGTTKVGANTVINWP
jgi:hypothetical protein